MTIIRPQVPAPLLSDVRPWWRTVKAETPQQAEEFCKRLGTGQCAAICLSHMSIHTTDGRCPEKERVWMGERE